MPDRPHVALLIETSNAYARGLLRGIYAYLREHRPWSIYLPEQGRGDAPPGWLKKWRGDGMIARIENDRIAKAVRAAGVPTVDVSANRLIPNLPCVETDNRAIAEMALNHFCDHGFKEFAFCGDHRFPWSQQREKWFAEFAQARGLNASIYPEHGGAARDSARSWEKQEKSLLGWLKNLPKPCGLMCCYDIRGFQVLDACRSAGIAVPDEIAVIGVDDDDLLCNLSDPPLTSIALDTFRTGYEAAKLLEQMIAGEKPAGDLMLIKPLSLVTRQSSDVLAVVDPDVSLAVRLIRQRACEGIKVDDVLAKVPLSRRVLEFRFKRILGHSPHDEILRVQLQRAKQLLAETSLPLAVVADRSGFKHVEYFSVAFKREFGQTPSSYRAEHRSKLQA
jgi:LacI family transcriptional regulator